MEQVILPFPANHALNGKILTGVVGSGDVEVLYTAAQGATLNIQIATPVDNNRTHWQALFDRLSLVSGLPAEQLIAHNFDATPDVARIHIEQVFEEATHVQRSQFHRTVRSRTRPRPVGRRQLPRIVESV